MVINADIIWQDRELKRKIAGDIKWDQEGGDWTFNVESDEVLRDLERVKRLPTLPYRDSIESNGHIFDIYAEVTPEHPMFFNALKDFLIGESSWIVDVREVMDIKKAPPGPPPRPGLEWKEETHRWVCGVEGCEEEGEHSHVVSETENGLKSLSGGFSFNDIEKASDIFNVEEAPSFVDSENYPGSLFDYIKTGYGVYNEVLRTHGYQDFSDPIDEILSVMKPIKEPQITYRGVNFRLDFEEGKEYPVDAFMSTSRNPWTAAFFSNGQTFMEVHSDPNAVGVTLSTTEYETLYGFGQKIRVESIKNNVILDGKSMGKYMVVTVIPGD